MIKKMMNNCFGALPTIYTETLSYYETVCKVLNKINEVIDEVNRATEIVDNNNTDVESVKQQMSGLSSELQRYKGELEQTLTDYNNSVNNRITEQNEKIDNGLSDIQEGVPEMVAGTVRGLIQSGEFDDIIGSEFEEAVSTKTVSAGETYFQYADEFDSLIGDRYLAKYSKVSGDVTLAYMYYYETPLNHSVERIYCPELSDGTYEIYMVYSIREDDGKLHVGVPADGNRHTENGYFTNHYRGDENESDGVVRMVIYKFAKVN